MGHHATSHPQGLGCAGRDNWFLSIQPSKSAGRIIRLVHGRVDTGGRLPCRDRQANRGHVPILQLQPWRRWQGRQTGKGVMTRDSGAKVSVKGFTCVPGDNQLQGGGHLCGSNQWTFAHRLTQCGYRYVPYSSMERIIEENKDSYYRALRLSKKKIRTESEKLDTWVLQTLKKQKDVLLLRNVEQDQLLARMRPVSEQLVALARERGQPTISEAVTLLAVNRNTAKLYLRQLVQHGHLLKRGTGKATWYGTP